MRKYKFFKPALSSLIVFILMISSISILAYETKANEGYEDLSEFIRPECLPYILEDVPEDELIDAAKETKNPDNYPEYDGKNYLETQKMSDLPELDDFSGLPGDPPEWADGYFIGAWGANEEVFGYFAGYYHLRGDKQGFYLGIWNTTDNTQVGAIWGFYNYIFTFGIVNVSEGARFPVVGFLLLNETHLAGRIMTLVGPPVYMVGIHEALGSDNAKEQQASKNVKTITPIMNYFKQMQNRFQKLISKMPMFRFALLQHLLRL